MRELKERLLKETVAHYRLGNRAANGHICVYEKENGCRCAIGRLMTNEGIAFLRQENALYDTLEVILGFKDSESFFREEWRPIVNYEDNNFSFLIAIQCLHDNEKNWNEKGISKLGLDKAEEIKKKYLQHE